MNNTHRTRFIETEELQELLHLSRHELRAVIENNLESDNFRFELLPDYTPRGGGHAPVHAYTEAL